MTDHKLPAKLCRAKNRLDELVAEIDRLLADENVAQGISRFRDTNDMDPLLQRITEQREVLAALATIIGSAANPLSSATGSNSS
jgi:hypothetical protein